jgi:hypothetical protein
VRAIDPTATTDDGVAIASSVTIGPILTSDLDDMMLHEFQMVLGDSSGVVTYQILIAPTAEAALTSSSVATGTWDAGRNLSKLIRRSSHAIYVRISSTNPWAMESVRMRIESLGKVRMRGGYTK